MGRNNPIVSSKDMHVSVDRLLKIAADLYAGAEANSNTSWEIRDAALNFRRALTDRKRLIKQLRKVDPDNIVLAEVEMRVQGS